MDQAPLPADFGQMLKANAFEAPKDLKPPPETAREEAAQWGIKLKNRPSSPDHVEQALDDRHSQSVGNELERVRDLLDFGQDPENKVLTTLRRAESSGLSRDEVRETFKKNGADMALLDKEYERMDKLDALSNDRAESFKRVSANPQDKELAAKEEKVREQISKREDELNKSGHNYDNLFTSLDNVKNVDADLTKLMMNKGNGSTVLKLDEARWYTADSKLGNTALEAIVAPSSTFTGGIPTHKVMVGVNDPDRTVSIIRDGKDQKIAVDFANGTQLTSRKGDSDKTIETLRNENTADNDRFHWRDKSEPATGIPLPQGSMDLSFSGSKGQKLDLTRCREEVNLDCQNSEAVRIIVNKESKFTFKKETFVDEDGNTVERESAAIRPGSVIEVQSMSGNTKEYYKISDPPQKPEDIANDIKKLAEKAEAKEMAGKGRGM